MIRRMILLPAFFAVFSTRKIVSKVLLMAFFAVFSTRKIVSKVLLPAFFAVFSTFSIICLKLFCSIHNVDQEKTYERKLQQRKNGAYVITVPEVIVRDLGAGAGKSITYHRFMGKTVLTLSGKDLTKKDINELEKYEKALDEVMRKNKEPKEEPKEHPKISKLEKLRIK